MNRQWLVTWWPRLVAAGVVLVVLAPAAVASYLHAREVVMRHDPAMANWLPITTDGMLLAALVVIWARRATRDTASRWIWCAFWLGGVVTVSANLAALLDAPRPGDTQWQVEAVVVAVWPPVTVAITLELAMLLAMAIQAAPARPPVLGPKRPSWFRRWWSWLQRWWLMRQWKRQLARTPKPVKQTPPAADGGVPATGGEEGPGGDRPSESDTPHETEPAPADPDAQLYARVVELMGRGYGRPTIIKELEHLGVKDGKPLRAMMDKARSNTNGSGH